MGKNRIVGEWSIGDIFLVAVWLLVLLLTAFAMIKVVADSHYYILTCVDKSGSEVVTHVTALSQEDVNAISLCKSMTFNPVDYRITEVKNQ